MDSGFLIYPFCLIFDILNIRKAMRVADKDTGQRERQEEGRLDRKVSWLLKNEKHMEDIKK